MDLATQRLYNNIIIHNCVQVLAGIFPAASREKQPRRFFG